MFRRTNSDINNNQSQAKDENVRKELQTEEALKSGRPMGNEAAGGMLPMPLQNIGNGNSPFNIINNNDFPKANGNIFSMIDQIAEGKTGFCKMKKRMKKNRIRKW